MKGMTPRAMAKACNGVFKGDEAVLDTEVKSITIDSRKISEGGLFIAIKGERSDGHDYINQCFEAGALCVMSEKELPDCAKPYIQNRHFRRLRISQHFIGACLMSRLSVSQEV